MNHIECQLDRQLLTPNLVKMVKLQKHRHIISVMSHTSFFVVFIGDPAMSRSS